MKESGGKADMGRSQMGCAGRGRRIIHCAEAKKQHWPETMPFVGLFHARKGRGGNKSLSLRAVNEVSTVRCAGAR
jgi:hypothetical protein